MLFLGDHGPRKPECVVMSAEEVGVSSGDRLDDLNINREASETPVISIILIGGGLVATVLWAAVLGWGVIRLAVVVFF